jgi:hypothetical protein
VPIDLLRGSDWSLLQDLHANVQLVLQHLARTGISEKKAESKSVSSVNTDIWDITRTTASKIIAAIQSCCLHDVPVVFAISRSSPSLPSCTRNAMANLHL